MADHEDENIEMEAPAIEAKEKLPDDEDSNEKSGFKMSMADVVDLAYLLRQWRNVSTHRKKIPKGSKTIPGASPQNPDSGSAVASILSAETPKEAAARYDSLRGRERAANEGKRNLSRSLLLYFINVSNVHHPQYSDHLDTEFLCSLLADGADLNTRDQYKQTVLHEVAKNWNPSVMSTIIDLGGDPNLADYRGRTPLHVAAATNFPEMCKLLVRRGADKEAKTVNGQTPLFFAAKTDSARSLQALVGLGCRFHDVHDARGRTALYCASELDRSETAAILMENGADAFVPDNSGQIAFVPMIEKMPPLAKEALQQLHKTYRIERKQYFELFRLDPKDLMKKDEETGDPIVNDRKKVESLLNVPYHSALKAITKTLNYALIETPVMKRYISQQWLQYGRIRAITQVVLQLVTILLWTVFAVAKEWTNRYQYNLPAETYRIIILAGAILLTVYSVAEEIVEYVRARRRHEQWKEWKLQRLEEDLKYCHAKQSDEQDYLTEEMEKVKGETVSYFEDAWNYLDWLGYVILLAALISHFVDVGYPGGEGNLVCARWHVRFLAINIVLLWLRLLKYVKPFEFFGPFIVMLGMIIGDVVKFFFLYLEFFIPFACVFWTILGGTNNLKEVDVVNSVTLANYSRYNLTKVSVKNFDTVNNLLFTLFRLTLVDEYDYDGMVEIDQVTAQLLLGAWFAVSSILFLNLFIAQLSETFKAVYDNAKAAAAMQKAITLIAFYEAMLYRSKVKYHTMLAANCNPLEAEYDDDLTEDNSGEEMQKATLQIRDTVNDMKVKFDRLYEMEMDDSEDEELEALREAAGEGGSTKGKSKQLAEGLSVVQDRLSRLESSVQQQLAEMRSMLRDVAIVVAGVDPDAPESRGGDQDAEESEEAAAAAGDRQQRPPSESGQQQDPGSHRIMEVRPADTERR